MLAKEPNKIELDQSLINGCIKYTGFYWIWYNETFLDLRIKFVSFFKYWQSSGSTATLLENAGAHGMIPFITAGLSTPYAIGGAAVTWVVTMYSRGPSIRKRMKSVDNRPSESVYKNSPLIHVLHWGIWTMAILSSGCVFLAAFLSGITLVNLTLMPILAYVLPASINLFLAAYIPTGLALFTAFSSWYSFWSYSIPRAENFALTKGKTLYRWLWEREKLYEEWETAEREREATGLGTKYPLYLTAACSILVVAASLFSGFFFVSHALSLIADTFGISALTHELITTIAKLFMIPSFITTISTKVDSVYSFFAGDKHYKILMAIKYNIENYLYGKAVPKEFQIDLPKGKNFLIFISTLAVLSVVDLFNSGIGAWISGCSVSRRLWGVDPNTLTGAYAVLSKIMLFLLACSDTLQNLTFTILPMLNEQVEDEQEKVNKHVTTAISLNPVSERIDPENAKSTALLRTPSPDGYLKTSQSAGHLGAWVSATGLGIGLKRSGRAPSPILRSDGPKSPTSFASSSDVIPPAVPLRF